ncbi:cysteine peptidase family C39 domain-containing protein [Escherichia coli]|uniref:peptidase domain-containing ABC transporter n=1 Tax=Escherichia coli TaxID=562 RepID=UPI002361F730|nr:cysteine peptidase family C39 domain-containing protein [Escherichia coli]MDD0832012.1 cysteine peptidase family C39 domain-containing protein [Escherichia coli]
MSIIIPRQIFQEETNECGLACIVMLAESCGKKITMEELRELYPVIKNGSTLYDLMVIAENIGLNCVPVKFHPGEIEELSLPAILHYEDNHFVYLAYKKGKYVCVMNPAIGMQILHYNSLMEHITGYALIVDEIEPYKENAKYKSSIFDYMSFLNTKDTAKIRGVYTLLFFTLIISLTGFIMPLMVNKAMNNVFENEHSKEFPYLVYFLSFLLAAFFGIAVKIYNEKIIKSFIKKESLTAFQNMISHPVRFYERRTVGNIFSRFQAWGDSLSQKIYLDNVLRGEWFICTISLVLMIYISPLLTVISCIAVTVMGIISTLSLQKDKYYTQEIQNKQSDYNDFLMETLQGIKTVKSTGIGRQRLLKFSELSHELYSIIQKQNIWEALKGSLYRITGTLETLLFVFVALPLLYAKSITFGEFFSYSFIKTIFSTCVTNIFQAVIGKYKVNLIDERARAIIKHNHNLTMKDNQHKSGQLKNGELRLRDICFSYNGTTNIINCMNLIFTPGSHSVLIGPSGVGKSTLSKIVSGTITPTSGELLFNDKKINESFLNEFVYYHSTDDVIFKASVIDNVSLFDMAQTDERKDEVRYILSELQLLDIIEKMPGGIYSLINQNNTSLSSGQLQRLLVARALYSNRQFIVLDEPTANLDDEMAVITIKAIKKICMQKKKTLLVISHSEIIIREFNNVIKL